MSVQSSSLKCETGLSPEKNNSSFICVKKSVFVKSHLFSLLIVTFFSLLSWTTDSFIANHPSSGYPLWFPSFVSPSLWHSILCRHRLNFLSFNQPDIQMCFVMSLLQSHENMMVDSWKHSNGKLTVTGVIRVASKQSRTLYHHYTKEKSHYGKLSKIDRLLPVNVLYWVLSSPHLITIFDVSSRKARKTLEVCFPLSLYVTLCNLRH